MRFGLAQKLILLLTAVVVTIGVVAGFVAVRAEERSLLRSMVLGADQLSRGITSATWHLMLADNRAAAYEVMQTIARKQGIERIRIFNREGHVRFSSKPNDPETAVSKSSMTCAVCHSALEPKVRVAASSRYQVIPGEGQRSLLMVTPVYNEPSCSQAACHAHPRSQKVLGVLDVTLGLRETDRELAEARFRIAIVFGAQILAISVLIVFFTRQFLAKPIRRLIAATRSVGEMNLDTPVKAVTSSYELGELASSFDLMRERLRTALTEINNFTQSLETKVEERTDQLKAAHHKLMQTDRLASLGTLAASVAHEINNPINGVLNLSMLMQRVLKDDGIPPHRIAEFRTYLSQVSSETSRVGRIVSDLLSFSRRSRPQRSQADLNRIVTSTVSLVAHKLKLSNVAAEFELAPDLPPVFCDASQIQQVVLNLVLNSAEATHGKPGARIGIRTRHDEPSRTVILSVSDNGEGIPAENLPKIFDPFFTTKPEGKGVGLGLAVLYGIVQSHGGEVGVESKLGKGTTFTVTLPLPSAVAPDEACEPGAAIGIT